MAENGPATAATTSSWAKRRTGDATAAESVITLAQPRPGTARRINEYTETPFKSKSGSPPGNKDVQSTGVVVVTAQPKKTAPAKSPDSVSSSSDGGDGRGSRQRLQESRGREEDDDDKSIICRQCGRCRCDACRTPKPLPSRWVCNDKFLCSAPVAVDYCSCLCCVQALFYHCDYGEDETGISCADQPCSCAPRNRCCRWGCMGLFSLCLPCLCCYLPLRGCLRVTEKVYGRLTSHGCRCDNSAPGAQHKNGNLKSSTERTEKRLLQNPDC